MQRLRSIIGVLNQIGLRPEVSGTFAGQQIRAMQGCQDKHADLAQLFNPKVQFSNFV